MELDFIRERLARTQEEHRRSQDESERSIAEYLPPSPPEEELITISSDEEFEDTTPAPEHPPPENWDVNIDESRGTWSLEFPGSKKKRKPGDICPCCFGKAGKAACGWGEGAKDW